MNATVTREELKDLCDWRMCSDPTPVDLGTDERLGELLDRLSIAQGYDNWVVAFHEIPQRKQHD